MLTPWLVIAAIICFFVWRDLLWFIVGLVIIGVILWSFSTFFLKIFGLFALVSFAVISYKKIKKQYIKTNLLKIAKDTIHSFKKSPSYNENMYIKPLETLSGWESPKEHYLKLEDKVGFYQESMDKINEMDSDLIYFNKGLFPYFHSFNNKLILETITEELRNNFGVFLDTLSGNYVLEKLSFDEQKSTVLEEYKRDFFINKNGITGEKRVNEELNMYSDDFINLENIRLEVDGESVETDNIVISEYGIFSIEVKNFSESGSYSLKITEDGQWLKVFNNGEMKPMKDVWSQVNRHLFYKQRFLEQQVPKEIGIPKESLSIQPIVVIANDQIIIDNQSGLPVIRASQLYRYMIKGKGNRLKPEQINFLTELFKKHTKESKSYPVLDYVPDLKTRYEELEFGREYINHLIPITFTYFEAILKNNRLKFALNISKKDCIKYEELYEELFIYELLYKYDPKRSF